MTEEIRFARNGDVQIAYETFGDPAAGRPLLLVMGLDFQMVWWHEELIDQLVDAGYAVVRFDNRDTGLSTHFPSLAAPSPWKALTGGVEPAYTVRDMLDDALAVMDAVGWSSAHVLGASMGAGLAQGLAMENPDRVRSLVSCMGLPVDSSPLRTLSYLRPGVFPRFRRIGGTGTTEEEQARALVEIFRVIASPGYPFPEEWAEQTARTSTARAPRDPSTTQRQIAAGRGHRYPGLETIGLPTLVISGADDPLIRWRAGRDTAALIPGARFVLFPGMGHAIPQELFPRVVAEIQRLA